MLLKRMKMDAKSFAALIDTLQIQGDVEPVNTPRAGSPFRGYRLIGEAQPGARG